MPQGKRVQLMGVSSTHDRMSFVLKSALSQCKQAMEVPHDTPDYGTSRAHKTTKSQSKQDMFEVTSDTHVGKSPTQKTAKSQSKQNMLEGANDEKRGKCLPHQTRTCKRGNLLDVLYDIHDMDSPSQKAAMSQIKDILDAPYDGLFGKRVTSASKAELSRSKQSMQDVTYEGQYGKRYTPKTAKSQSGQSMLEGGQYRKSSPLKTAKSQSKNSMLDLTNAANRKGSPRKAGSQSQQNMTESVFGDHEKKKKSFAKKKNLFLEAMTENLPESSQSASMGNVDIDVLSMLSTSRSTHDLENPKSTMSVNTLNKYMTIDNEESEEEEEITVQSPGSVDSTTLHGEYSVERFPPIEYEHLLEGKVIKRVPHPVRFSMKKSYAPYRPWTTGSKVQEQARQVRQHPKSAGTTRHKHEEKDVAQETASKSKGEHVHDSTEGSKERSFLQANDKKQVSILRPQLVRTPSERGYPETVSPWKPRPRMFKAEHASTLITHCSSKKLSEMGVRKVPLHEVQFVHPNLNFKRARQTGTLTKEQMLKQYDPVPQCDIYEVWMQNKMLTEEEIYNSVKVEDVLDIHKAYEPGRVDVPLAWNRIAERATQERNERTERFTNRYSMGVCKMLVNEERHKTAIAALDNRNLRRSVTGHRPKALDEVAMLRILNAPKRDLSFTPTIRISKDMFS